MATYSSSTDGHLFRNKNHNMVGHPTSSLPSFGSIRLLHDNEENGERRGSMGPDRDVLNAVEHEERLTVRVESMIPFIFFAILLCAMICASTKCCGRYWGRRRRRLPPRRREQDDETPRKPNKNNKRTIDPSVLFETTRLTLSPENYHSIAITVNNGTIEEEGQPQRKKTTPKNTRMSSSSQQRRCQQQPHRDRQLEAGELDEEMGLNKHKDEDDSDWTIATDDDHSTSSDDMMLSCPPTASTAHSDDSDSLSNEENDHRNKEGNNRIDEQAVLGDHTGGTLPVEDSLAVAIPAGITRDNETARTRMVPNLCAICLDNFHVGQTIVWSPEYNGRHANEDEEGQQDLERRRRDDGLNFDIEQHFPTSSCSHAYHEECIVQVLERDTKCPLCRQPFVVLEEEAEEEEEEQGNDDEQIFSRDGSNTHV